MAFPSSSSSLPPRRLLRPRPRPSIHTTSSCFLPPPPPPPPFPPGREKSTAWNMVLTVLHAEYVTVGGRLLFDGGQGYLLFLFVSHLIDAKLM